LIAISRALAREIAIKEIGRMRKSRIPGKLAREHGHRGRLERASAAGSAVAQ
jgi:hypothetical protein